MKTLRIGHLYPKLLNIYGDIGNIITMKKRCEWRGIDVVVDEINRGDSFGEHDFYFMGGGQDVVRPFDSQLVCSIFTHYRSENLRQHIMYGYCLCHGQAGGYTLHRG